MKKAISLCLIVAAAFAVFGRATCGRANPARVTPTLKTTFTDHVRYHNMGITFDGQYYYTINGGNEDHCDLNQYDDAGKFLQTYDVELDGRAIFYNSDQEKLLVKDHSGNLNSLDLDIEYYDAELEDVFDEEQSSPGFSPDGRRAYELADGEVRVIDLESGEEDTTFELARYSEQEDGGYAYAIAASDKFLFTWLDKNLIAVHDLNGRFITSFELPRPGFGFSLSWTNGLLWAAADADGSEDGADGTWYGYKLTGLNQD